MKEVNLTKEEKDALEWYLSIAFGFLPQPREKHPKEWKVYESVKKKLEVIIYDSRK